MQYAKVVVDQPLKNHRYLLFSIPPELLADIKIGQVVTVSIRNQKKEGIIIGLTTRKPDTLRLAPIIAIQSKDPVINSGHIMLYEKIAAHFGVSISDVLFYFLPPLLKKITASINPKSLKHQMAIKTHVCYGTTYERFSLYKKIIGQNKNKSLIFIFGDHDLLHEFKNFIPDIDAIVYTGSQSKTERWNAWSIIHNNPSIVLTTRIGLGLHPDIPTLYIIDQPYHPGFKEDRRPKITVEELLPILKEINTPLVLGYSFPTTRLLYHQKNIINFPSIEKVLLTNTTSPLTTVTNKRTLIAIPQKGEWNGVFCQDCKQALQCNKCQSSLKLIQKKIICSVCQIEYTYCHNCHGTHLDGFGMGSTELAKWIDNTTNYQLLIVDLAHPNSTNTINAAKTVVATHKIFDYPVAQFDRVICYNFDSFLNIPDRAQEEKIFLSLVSFLQLGKEKIIITKRPTNRVYQLLGSGKTDHLIKKLVKEAYPYFPPFVRDVRLTYKKTLDTATMEKIKKISVSVHQLPNNQILAYVVREHWSEFIDEIKSLSNITYNPEPRDS